MPRALQSIAAFLALSTITMSAEPCDIVATYDASRVRWSRLTFEARKLFLKGTIELRLTSVSGSELDDQLIASPRSVAVPADGSVSRLDVETALAGRESEIKIWFDPGEAFALQRLKLRHGKKAYSKTYRFTRDGVFSHRRSPSDSSESGLSPEKWGKVEETFYSHPEERDCPKISEPTVLFYLLAAAELSPDSESLRLCTFSGKVLSRVELQPAGSERLAVDYVARSSNGDQRRKAKIETSRFAVETRSAGSDEGDFEFLGLEGDVEIFLDGRVPVQVSGRLPGLGRVNVKLVEVELKYPREAWGSLGRMGRLLPLHP